MFDLTWTAQPYQRDHGQSVAICRPSSEIICLIRPLGTKLTEQDRRNASLIAAAPAMFSML